MANILIIDDCTTTRMLMRAYFILLGHDVGEATTGIEGERKFSENGADLIFIDIFMPDQDGLQTIRNIRKTNIKVPIVAMSSGGKDNITDFLTYTIEFGATIAVEKPLTKVIFDQIFETIFNERFSCPAMVANLSTNFVSIKNAKDAKA